MSNLKAYIQVWRIPAVVRPAPTPVELSLDHEHVLTLDAAPMQVVRKVLDMLLALIRALSKLDEPAGSDLETWESLVLHCKTLESSANDLVAGTITVLCSVDSICRGEFTFFKV